MLVAVDLVIEMAENGLHRGGELHVEIEEIDRKGHREKREAYDQPPRANVIILTLVLLNAIY